MQNGLRTSSSSFRLLNYKKDRTPAVTAATGVATWSMNAVFTNCTTCIVHGRLKMPAVTTC